MREIRAVLFDMDGLLLDTERVSQECACETALEMGYEIDRERVARGVMGVRRSQAVEAYAAVLPEGMDAAAFYARKNEKMRKRLETEGVQVKKGARELLEWLNMQGIRCALATSTSRESAESHLRSTGLWELLPFRVTGDQVEHSKPHPEIYLTAAAQTGVEMGKCLVLEDSIKGLQAGRAAGAVVGMVPDTLPCDADCALCCDVVFEDLSQVIGWMQQ